MNSAGHAVDGWNGVKASARERNRAASGQLVGRVRGCGSHVLGGAQQQQATFRRLIAAVERDCEVLACNGWQVERKRRSVGHGRGVPVRRKHARLATVCYVISADYATASAILLTSDA